MWGGEEFVTIEVPESGSEGIMIPVIRAVVRNDEDPDLVLLQRRDIATESVRGLLEIPGGRWRAGEAPAEAIAREVFEETGIRVTTVDGVSTEPIADTAAIATVRPLSISVGVDGAFPGVHVVLIASGAGTPRAVPGETADVRWWNINDVRNALADNRSGFVPASYAALRAYVEWVGSTG